MQLSPRARFAAAVAYGAAAVVAAFVLLRDAFANKIVGALKTGFGDCVMNWLGGRAWERGIDIYSKDGLRWAQLPSYGHPPTTPLWYLPFTAYGIFELNQVYGHFLLLLLFIHCVLVAAELRAPVTLATALLAYGLVSDTSWWANHIAMIQLSEPIAFLYVLAWIFLRRDHEIASGVMIGLALTLKLYAGLLIVMLLVGKRWRGAVAAGATWLVFAVVASWRFGIHCWGEYMRLLPDTQDMWTGHIRNASVPGIVLRLFEPACQGRGARLAAATAIATIFSLALVAAIAWFTRKSLVRQNVAVQESIDIPFALFSTASPWINPYLWEHYDVTLILPIGIALLGAWRLAPRDRRIWAPLVTAILVGVALLLSINIWEKTQALQIYFTTKTGHARMHWLEAANWLPWPMTLTALALVWWRRLRADGASPPAAAA